MSVYVRALNRPYSSTDTEVIVLPTPPKRLIPPSTVVELVATNVVLANVPIAPVPLPINKPPLENVAAPVPPLTTPNVPEVIAEVSIAIAVFDTVTTRPYTSVSNVATLLAEPKVLPV